MPATRHRWVCLSFFELKKHSGTRNGISALARVTEWSSEAPCGGFQSAGHHPVLGDLDLYPLPAGDHLPPSQGKDRRPTYQHDYVRSQSHSKGHAAVAQLPRCHLEGLAHVAPHGAKVVKKMYILTRKVVTEPCRHSFISTSRAKSRGSRTDLCRDTTPV